MRLKSFTAASMSEAMRQIRDELGEDAVIVSTQRVMGNQGVRVTAALEETGEIPVASVEPLAPPQAVAAIDRALSDHGTPRWLIDRLTGAAHGAETEPLALLVHILESSFRFEPLSEDGESRPIALVGPPGVGKTVATAKLAARRVLAKRPVRVISTDSFRAGGVDQLAVFTNILGVKLHTAASPRELQEVATPAEPGELILVDTANVNPFSKAELVRLAELTDSIRAEPVLTLAAGGDAEEAAEIGEVFGAIGATRMIVTRLDAARRLGAVLSAADGGRLGFCEVSTSPHVSRGLRPIDPQALARLLLSHQAEREAAEEPIEAQR
ncbi:MAG: GTP-binding protein [Alphaproteobacteria bacterium]